MIKSLFRALYMTMWVIVFLILLMIASFMFLCFNVFTIPLLILSMVFCKITQMECPHIALYSLMLYPSWRSGEHPSFLSNVGNAIKTHNARRKVYYPIRAWEERFF